MTREINSPIRLLFPYKDKIIEWSRPCIAKIYYPNETHDLLLGVRYGRRDGQFAGKEELFKSLKKEQLNTERSQPKAFHLFYELGFLFQSLDHALEKDTILGVELEFDCVRKLKRRENKGTSKDKRREWKERTAWSRADYGFKFREGYQHLKNGNCYQFNLTKDFNFEYRGKEKLTLDDFTSLLWGKNKIAGAYASLTDLGFGDFLLSNSPECLFQLRKSSKKTYRLETMPIKGTSKAGLWESLKNSIKDESELYMIIDLLRNDLSRIGLNQRPPTIAKVLNKKAPLLVPGLIHQYGHIALDTKVELNLYKVIEAMFPGGSITGAPKKRVMEILLNLEQRKRGFYCGSTILLHKNLQAASINIRSAIYSSDKNSLLYQAGGGITLLSNEDEEYGEMRSKLASFIDLL